MPAYGMSNCLVFSLLVLMKLQTAIPNKNIRTITNDNVMVKTKATTDDLRGISNLVAYEPSPMCCMEPLGDMVPFHVASTSRKTHASNSNPLQE